MSQQVRPDMFATRGVGAALAGVVFCDFIGLLLFAVPVIGGPLACISMFGASTYVAWMTLEGRSNRGLLTTIIGVGNALFLVVGAITLLFIALANVSFG
jgi:hypothetical protein